MCSMIPRPPKSTPPAAFAPPTSNTEATIAIDRLSRAMEAAADRLGSLQRDDGAWSGDPRGDVGPTAEYVLLLAALGRLSDPNIAKASRFLEASQSTLGGWSVEPGGRTELGLSVKTYFAIKLAGASAEDESLRRARFQILELGGAERADARTLWFLAILGQVPYSYCPTVPVELLLAPPTSRYGLMALKPAARAIAVPLAILSHFQPRVEIAREQGIAELFRTPLAVGVLPPEMTWSERMVSPGNGFRALDRVIKAVERFAPRSWRRRALERCERWMVEHFEGAAGFGGRFAPLPFVMLALRQLDYSDDSAECQWAEERLSETLVEEDDTLRALPFRSPVVDTAWSMLALAEAGVPSDAGAMSRAADWLMNAEVREPGDWKALAPEVEPSGWSFVERNHFYPGVFETAAVLAALRRSERFGRDAGQRVLHRALCWLLGMQGKDHGWAAFERPGLTSVYAHVPFAAPGALVSLSRADVTARAIETLGDLGYRRGKPFIDDAIRYLLDRQAADGYWVDAAGDSAVRTTSEVLIGLASIGYDPRHPRLRRATEWLRSHQDASGAWIEPTASASSPSAVLTSWAMMGLIAVGESDNPTVEKGVAFLLSTQNEDGGWDDATASQSGPDGEGRVRPALAPLYFPLLALARYLRATSGAPATAE